MTIYRYLTMHFFLIDTLSIPDEETKKSLGKGKK